jgi:hypothetical protein
MNEHLICPLCMGYFRDAMTVTECLHTFCKPCIIKHFDGDLACPTCEVNLGPTPLEKIRTDRAMQNIVDKVFPHFAKEEAAAEKHLQREATTENQQRSQAASQESDAKRKKVMHDLQAKKKQKVFVSKTCTARCENVPTVSSLDWSNPAKLPALTMQINTFTQEKEAEQAIGGQKLCLSLFPNESAANPLPKLSKPFLR